MNRSVAAAGVAALMSLALAGCSSGDDTASRVDESASSGSDVPVAATDDATTTPDAPVATIDAAGPVGGADATGATLATTAPTERPVREDGLETPEGDEPEVLGPLGSTEVEFGTDEGSVQIGTGEIPASVPDDFPVPDDLEVQLSSDIGDQAGFSGTSGLTFDELVEFYRTGLPAVGYQLSEDQFVAGTVAVFGFDGGDGRGQVAISGAPGGGRSVIVTFER